MFPSFLLVVPLFAVFSTVADEIPEARCIDPLWNWSFNSRKQDPCTVALALGDQCYPEGYFGIPAATSGEYYYPPIESTPCVCNTVYYSLISACAQCQGTGANVTAWPDWSSNCTNTTNDYPEPIPDDVVVPNWTSLPLSDDGTVNFTAAKLDTGIETGQASCIDPQWGWSFNLQSQDPCHVATALLRQCDPGGRSWTPILGVGDTYNALISSTPCLCSALLYTLISVCAECQDANIVTYPNWVSNCTNPSLDYPLEFPEGISVPDWAFLPLLDNGTVNFAAARLDRKPDLTTNPSLKHSAKTAIAGGIAGSLVFLALLALGVWFVRRRRGQNRFPPPASIVDFSAHQSDSPIYRQLLNPPDPTDLDHHSCTQPRSRSSHTHSVSNDTSSGSLASISSVTPLSPSLTLPSGDHHVDDPRVSQFSAVGSLPQFYRARSDYSSIPQE